MREYLTYYSFAAQMAKSFLIYIYTISILFWSASMPIFAHNSAVNTTEISSIDIVDLNQGTTFLESHDIIFFDIKIPSLVNKKRIEVIETRIEEEVERISSENCNSNKTSFFDIFISLKSEEIAHQAITDIAIRSYFSNSFSCKSLFKRFCSFRI